MFLSSIESHVPVSRIVKGTFLFEEATCWPQGRIHLFIFGLILLYYKNKIAIYTHLTWGATRSSHTEKMALILPSPSPKIIRRK